MELSIELPVRSLIGLVRSILGGPKAPDVDYSEVEKAIAHHLAFLESWSSQVPFAGLPGERDLDKVFMHLPLALIPKRKRALQGPHEHVTTEELLSTNQHVVLLGDPGSGKTTIVKHISQHLLHEAPTHSADQCQFPVVLRCRDAKGQEDLFQWLLATLGVMPRRSGQAHATRNKQKYERLIAQFLDDNRGFLIVDGLDEVASSDLQRTILDQFASLVHVVSSGRLLLTCRSGALDSLTQGAHTYELAPLNSKEIETFCTKWITDDEQRADLLQQLQASPYLDTASRPLALAHLCAIYHNYGTLPDRPKSVYRKVISLLLEEWDRVNATRRQSRYAHFGPDRKAEFLSALAYAAAINGHYGSFSTSVMMDLYREICEEFELPKGEARQVISEIESHAGLVVQCGVSDYEFAHLSLQEYLCADYLVRGQVVSLGDHQLAQLPSELAIATALASNPTSWFISVIRRIENLRGSRPALFRVENGPPRAVSFYARYLGRMALERPDFSTDEEFGRHVLLILSHVSEHIENTQWKGVRSFCELPAVQRSLRQLMANCDELKADKHYLRITLFEESRRIAMTLLPPRIRRAIRESS